MSFGPKQQSFDTARSLSIPFLVIETNRTLRALHHGPVTANERRCGFRLQPEKSGAALPPEGGSHNEILHPPHGSSCVHSRRSWLEWRAPATVPHIDVRDSVASILGSPALSGGAVWDSTQSFSHSIS